MAKGHLVIIGGAEDRENEKHILRRFVALSGGSQSRIAVLTAASEQHERMKAVYEAAFEELGAGRVTTMQFQTREDAGNPAQVQALYDATGIFITGGAQAKLMRILGGSDAARAMHRAFREKQACIAGTSAGASAMSEYMVIEGRHGLRPEKNMLTIGAGFGFVQRVIIDQHFAERHRQARLLSTIAANPYLLGVGIDEDTALVIEPNRSVEVVGEGTVTIFDGRHMTYSNIEDVEEGASLAMSNIILHLLTPGFRYHFETGLHGGPDAAPEPNPALHELLQVIAGFPTADARETSPLTAACPG